MTSLKKKLEIKTSGQKLQLRDLFSFSNSK